MSTMKKLIPVIVLSCMGMIFIPLYGQEEPSFMYHDKKEEGESDSIYTGLLIAYGELHEPPFLVEMRDDTVWINDMPINPYIKIWHEETPIIEVSEVRKQQIAVRDSLYMDYVRYHNAHGEPEATNLIQEKYQDHPLIADIEFQKRDKLISNIHIEWTDGYTNNLRVSEIRSTEGFILPEPYQTQEEKINERRLMMETTKSQLKKDYLVITSYGAGSFRRPGVDSNQLITILQEIANDEMTREQAKEQYPGILPSFYTFWKEFDIKKETWK